VLLDDIRIFLSSLDKNHISSKDRQLFWWLYNALSRQSGGLMLAAVNAASST